MTFYPRSETGQRVRTDANDPGVAHAYVRRFSVAAAVGSANAIKNDLLLDEGGTLTTDFAQPDVPRCLQVVGSGVAVTGNVVVTGTNAAGAIITETLALNGTTPVVGVKAFKLIVSIDFPADSGATGETIDVGTTDKIGLPDILRVSGLVLLKLFDGAADAGSLTVDVDELEKNVYDPAGTLNGAKVLELYYFV